MTDEWKAPAKASAESGDEKSWKLLEKTLLASVQEQRRSRRWGIFFKLLTFVYLFGALILFTPLMDMEKAATRSGNYTALIDVTGMIADKEPASADNIVGSLRAAFEDEKVKGVILRINSPGGSPVQSGYVYDEIRRLRGLHPDTKALRGDLRPGRFRCLLHRQCGRSDLCRQGEPGGFHWCDGGRLWLCRDHGEAGCRASHLHLGRAQVVPRSVPAAEA